MTTPTLDQETFVDLVLEYQTALYRTARSILSNQQDVEDAVQEAICSAFVHREKLRQAEKFKPWLLRILVNVCYDTCRRRRPLVDLEQVAPMLTTPELDQTEVLSLWDAVLQLPDPLRAVVTLFYYEDCSIVETANILCISQGAVKTRLNRARARLRQFLTEE